MIKIERKPILINVKTYRQAHTPEFIEMLDNMRRMEKLPVDKFDRYMAIVAKQIQNDIERRFLALCR